ALETRAGRGGPEGRDTERIELIDEAVDQGLLRSHDDEVHRLSARHLHQPAQVAGGDRDVASQRRRAAIARRHEDLRDLCALGETPGERVLTTTTSDDE